MVRPTTEGYDWVQILIAIGTLGAALSAGWAAWQARRSAIQAERLIEFEWNRDERAADEALWSQARRLSVDLMHRPGVLEDGGTPIELSLKIGNFSADPLFKCRAKMVVGGETWGPILLGTLPPGETLSVTAQLTVSFDDDADAFVRATDCHGNAWVATARGDLQPVSGDSLSKWIEDGAAFAERARREEGGDGVSE